MEHRMQKKWIYSSLLIGGLLSTTIYGAKRDKDVDKALKEQYPNAKTEILDTRDVNGVKVSDVKVTTDKGEAMAKVTEYGDFVVVGEPRGDNNIAKPAQDTLNGLFKAGQQDVDVYKVTCYLVDVTSGKKTFRLAFDPVGKLHDIYNDADIKKEDVKNLEKADDKDKSDKADDYAKKYLPGDKVEGVYRAPDVDDFFIVDMKQKDGKDARITLNNAGRVYSQREEVDKGELPKPITAALDQMFDNTKISRAYRSEYEYYQMDKVSTGGDKVSVQIRPNGDVLHVHNEAVAKEQSEKAAVASHKETGTKDKDKKKNK